MLTTRKPSTTLTRCALPLLLLPFASLASAQVAVTTYHYDNSRTGWNSSETALTPANVNSTTFGLLKTVSLDGQVDGQPLVVPNVAITSGRSQGIHTVVYVATSANSIYAIDANDGTTLLRNSSFGMPVPRPLGCSNNSPTVGMASTPVIDLTTNTLYAMAYTQTSGVPAYYLHALDLGSLSDKVTPQLVTGTSTLSNGATFSFNAAVQRQRAGLVLANGNVYAAFGSFCDFSASQSRGWLLGWQAGALTPLPTNELVDKLATSPHNYFLSSIWMSGYAPATDYAGNILFVTGNSDAGSYDGVRSLQESVVKVSPFLSAVLDVFTPSNQASLDQSDADFGSGGVMTLPTQAGSIPHLAVAAGKDGNMFLMNEDALGGYSTTTNHVLGTYPVGGCWCGPSYFQDPGDGAARVVSSGGNTVKVWKLATAPSPSLSLVTSSPAIVGGQNPGFFTTVSSNGTASPIIWALSHPTSVSGPVYLYAFDPESGGSTMNQLLSTPAGTWPNVGGTANLVPVVANGKVYVASFKQLEIFGLLP